MAVAVGLGVACGVPVGVADGLGERVAEGVAGGAVGVGLAVSLAVALAVVDGVGESETTLVGEGVGPGLIAWGRGFKKSKATPAAISTTRPAARVMSQRGWATSR